MNNRQLKRHDTLPNLTETQTDLGSPDSRHDGLNLPPDPTAIADPWIFMLSEAIKRTLDSLFTGLQSTLTAISNQMERIASRPSPFHAHGAGGRISLRTPTSARARVSPRRHRAATSEDGSPSPSSQSGGGGGGLPDRRGTIPQEDEDSDDAISLLPAEEIPLPAMAQKESKFRVYQDTITKTSESLASPLPEDMASCFNATYHKPSLAFTLNSVAVQQLDQVRRSGFKPVLPTHLKGLAKPPPPPFTT